MRKLLRDAFATIRQMGGAEITVTEGGRHTRLTFSINGTRQTVLLNRGVGVTDRYGPMLRSQIRRKCGAGAAR